MKSEGKPSHSPKMPLPSAIQPVANRALAEVSDVQLAGFAELVYGRTEIRVSPQKRILLWSDFKGLLPWLYQRPSGYPA